MIDAERPFAVIDAQGQVVGQLERRAVLDVLVTTSPEADRG